MKNNPFDNPLKYITELIIRYNFVIFVVIVSVGLMSSVLLLNEMLNRPYSNGSTTGDNPTIFDKSVITSLEKLQPSSSNKTYKTPATGRSNPFTE